MSMRDEPWDQLQKRSRPGAAPRSLSPDEALQKFGDLKETLTDGIVPMDRYRTFPGEGGFWKPTLDQMKRLTGYKLHTKR